MNGVRVLLIDDEVPYTDALAKRLGRRGLSVMTAGGGAQALEIMAANVFDVILLDIKMAGMDGIKTLSAIKRRHPEVEVVMLTAHANTDIVISSLAMGAFDYVLKPAEVEELVRKIDDAARTKRSNSK
ncbi:response regulator [Pseudodesulfovibrio karagichevae]|uniref:Response regulator n=1 Tax=Pseudodesulfovibrio karagichevae TaxID=3239305 RepID=A0ABV4K1K4_9BACT